MNERACETNDCRKIQICLRWKKRIIRIKMERRAMCQSRTGLTKVIKIYFENQQNPTTNGIQFLTFVMLKYKFANES